MIFNSFKKKLISALILLPIIPIVILGIVVNLTVKEQIINQAIDIRTQFVVNKADEINRWFSDKEKTLQTIASDYLAHKKGMDSVIGSGKVSSYLTNLAKSIDYFSDIYIIIKDEEKDDFVLLADEIDIRIKSLYDKVLKTGDTLWSQPYEDLKTGKMILTVFMPIKDETGDIKEVIGANIFIKSIEDIFKELRNKLVADGFIVSIINSEGEIVDFLDESNKFASIFDKDLRNLNLAALIDGNNEKISIKDKEYFVIKSNISKIGWKLVCLIDKDVFFGNIMGLNKYIIITVIFTIIFVILLASLLSNQFSKPLQELKKGTIELYKGNYDYRISIYKNDEFGQLAKAFNRTIEELGKSYKRLSEQAEILIGNNKQLQSMNMELEASYEQLQAMALELNESEEKYRLLVENMNDLVWAIDSNYRITFVNDQIKDMLKYDKEEAIGTDIRDFLSKIWYFNSKEGKSDNLNSDFEKLLESDYDSVQVVLISKNGKEVIGEVSTRRIFDKGELIGVHGVLRDITERKELYSQIIRKNKELSTINKISKNLNSTMDINKLLKMVVDDIVDLMKIPLCTIRLLTEDDKLKLMAYSGELMDIVWFDEIPVDEDILGEAIKKGDIIKLSNFTEENISKYNKKLLRAVRLIV